MIAHKQRPTVAKCCSRTQSRRNIHILFYIFSALHTQDHCMLITENSTSGNDLENPPRNLQPPWKNILMKKKIKTGPST